MKKKLKFHVNQVIARFTQNGTEFVKLIRRDDWYGEESYHTNTDEYVHAKDLRALIEREAK